MNYTCFTDTNGLAIDYYFRNRAADQRTEMIKSDITHSLGIIKANCRTEGYNGSTSRIVESYLDVAYQMVMPMDKRALAQFRDLIKPIESTDIDRDDLERRLSKIEQLAYH